MEVGSYDEKRKPKIWEALVPIVGMALIIVYSMLVLKVDPHIPIVISTILAGFMALRVGCSWSEVREGMIESIYRAVEALIIVMIVGMLIGSWVLAGSVPAMIYYGLELISPTFFYQRVAYFVLLFLSQLEVLGLQEGQ